MHVHSPRRRKTLSPTENRGGKIPKKLWFHLGLLQKTKMKTQAYTMYIELGKRSLS